MIKLDVAHKKFIEQLKGEGKTPATLIAYNKDVGQLLEHLSKNGIETVDFIKLEHLENFMKKLFAENYTPKSISRKTNATRTFVRYLHKSGFISENISDLLKHPKLDNKAPRILSKLEYRALRDASREDIRSYAMIEVLLQTGITISELAEIEMENIKIENDAGTLFVPKKNAKESRNIPLNKSVVEALNKYIKEGRNSSDQNSKHLFVTKTGKPLLIRNIRSTIGRFFKIAGVSNAKVNDLRHTFIAHHLSEGVNLLHLSKIAGHKRISTTERYLQYIEKVTVKEKTELGIL